MKTIATFVCKQAENADFGSLCCSDRKKMNGCSFNALFQSLQVFLETLLSFVDFALWAGLPDFLGTTYLKEKIQNNHKLYPMAKSIPNGRKI
jgi:hypothetical protein